MQRAPNIRDVARLAGVSYQTVSRVLNDSPSVRQATRERVLGVIEQLGYRPNQAARVLATARSGTIGVLTSQTAQYGPSTSLTAIELAAARAGYRLSITTLQGVDDAAIRTAIDALLVQRVEALVVIAPQARVIEVLAAVDIAVPYVTLQGTADDEHGLSIDQVAGARLATRHLIDAGHTRIAHIAGPLDWPEAAARFEGHRAELREAGLPERAPALGDWTARSGFEAGAELLRSGDVTAVFAANDQMALGFLRACALAGVRVPDDLSLIGFDDIPEAAFLVPALTTVRQDFPEIGRRAVAALLAELRGEPAAHPPLTPELVVRESTR